MPRPGTLPAQSQRTVSRPRAAADWLFPELSTAPLDWLLPELGTGPLDWLLTELDGRAGLAGHICGPASVNQMRMYTRRGTIRIYAHRQRARTPYLTHLPYL